MSTIIGRQCRHFSFVGRRPIVLEKGITYDIAPMNIEETGQINSAFFNVFRPHKRIPMDRMVSIHGPLGTRQFPLAQGMKLLEVPSKETGQTTLSVSLPDNMDGLNKYQQRFLHSLWGTTASALRSCATGVSEGFVVVLRMVGVGYRMKVEDIALPSTNQSKEVTDTSKDSKKDQADSSIQRSVAAQTDDDESVRFPAATKKCIFSPDRPAPGPDGQAIQPNKKLIMKVGFCHNVHVDIPADISIELASPTKAYLTGTNFMRLRQFAYQIRAMREPNVYSGKGIYVDDEVPLRKEVKKK